MLEVVAPRPAGLVRGAAAPRSFQRRSIAVALGVCLGAVAALYLCASPAAGTQRAELFEGESAFSGEDAALRQLYDSDGERVPGAVIASQALAEADMPAEARSAVRRARQNLEDVRRAATAAAMLKIHGSDEGSSTSAAGVDAAWKIKMDKAMGGHGADRKVSSPDLSNKANPVAARFQETSQREQSNDFLKEQMETLMRRKMSEMKLEVSRQLRSAREHQEVDERRTNKEAHVEVEALKKRLLKQREKMEKKIVELSTEAHHFKSEAENMAAGSDPDAPREKTAVNTRPVQEGASSRGLSGRGNDPISRTGAQDAQDKKLEAEVQDLKAEFAKQKALFRSAHTPIPKENRVKSKSVSPAVEESGDAANARSIKKIEDGYFQDNGVTSGAARAQMQDIVAKQEAHDAAKSKKRNTQKIQLHIAHADPAATASPTVHSERSLVQWGSGVGAKAEAPRLTTQVPSMKPAAREPRKEPAPEETAASAGAADDAGLKARLRVAIAQRDEAEVVADAYSLQAKDREIDELENELALDQRVLALNQMQTERQDLDRHGGLIPSGIASPRESVESLQTFPEHQRLGSVDIDYPRQVLARMGRQRMAFEKQEGGMEAMAGVKQTADAPTAVAGALARAAGRESRAPRVAWEDRGSEGGMAYGDEQGTLQQGQNMVRPAPSSGSSPQRAGILSRPRAEGIPVDLVPAWSARVRALEDRALEHGFQLVPAHAGQERSPQATYEDARASPPMSHPGRQSLAAVKAPMVDGASPDAPRQAQRAAMASAQRSRAVAQGRPGAAVHQKRIPEGLDGSSLLDQIGREFYSGAKSIFENV